MLKRWMVLCLALVLALSNLVFAHAVGMTYANFLEGDFGEDYPMSMASFKGQLYVLGGSGIYLLSPTEGSVKLLTVPTKDITDPSHSFLGMEHLFADEEGLLVYEGSTKTLHRVHLTKTRSAKTVLCHPG